MYSRGGRQFWIDEVCQLTSGAFVIPRSWILRKRANFSVDAAPALHADASVVEITLAGWRITSSICSVLAEDFKWNYFDIVSHAGGVEKLVWLPSTDGSEAPVMPCLLRKLVDENEDLYVVMVSPWSDDVSGNRSKQYNKHMNVYISNGCLPGRLAQQEFHVHFLSTSPSASSSEQFSAIRDQVKYVKF
jgi:hypothetical protein